MNAHDPKFLAKLARAEMRRRARQMKMKEEAERDLLAFVRMFWHVLEPETKLVTGWVLEVMCDALMAVTDGHQTRVIENVPPGCMKSLLLNVFWPAWEWGPQNMPWMRYLSASYTTSLPERDNGRFQRLINDPLYRACWGERFTVFKDSVEQVENDKTGWKRVIAMRGATTGWRGNRILIDDANNPINVESDDVRHATNLWLREVMPDRLNNLDRDAIVNIQQRTHSLDATNTLAEMWGNKACWVCVPMEFDPLRIGRAVLRWTDDGDPEQEWVDPRSLDENGKELKGLVHDEKGTLKIKMGSPMAKAEGTLAWPKRFSPGAVADLKKSKADYAWAGQYQQMPTSRGGGMIRRDWWQLWPGRQFPAFGTTVASLDTAYEENQEADYNALTVWSAFPSKDESPLIMLTAAKRMRLPLAQLCARVAEICEERKVDFLLVEHKSRGRDVHDEIRRIYQTAAWDTLLVKVSASKSQRLAAVSELFSGPVRKDPVTGSDVWGGGIIYAPDTSWADEVIDEVSAFPRAPHDDYVDSTSMALGWMRRNGVALRRTEFLDQEFERKKFKPRQKIPYTIE